MREDRSPAGALCGDLLRAWFGEEVRAFQMSERLSLQTAGTEGERIAITMKL